MTRVVFFMARPSRLSPEVSLILVGSRLPDKSYRKILFQFTKILAVLRVGAISRLASQFGHRNLIAVLVVGDLVHE